jgi:hypothetical protein
MLRSHTLEKTRGNPCTGDWVSLGAGTDGTENLAATGIQSPTVQAAPSRYTDYANTGRHYNYFYYYYYNFYYYYYYYYCYYNYYFYY